MSAPRFMLSGYYGFGNLGDEALLDVIVAQLRARYPACSIDVLSGDPDGTRTRLGVLATPRMDLTAVGRSIERADVILSGGGGLLQDATSLRSLLYYAGVIRAATRARKTTMVFAQSIGPLDLWGRAVVRTFCGGIAAATVRDERSRRLLGGLLPKVRVERTADPVFLFEPAEAPLDLRAEGFDDSAPLAIVSVRRATGSDTTAQLLSAAIDHLAGRYAVQVGFVPLGGAPDADVSSAIIRRSRTTPVLLPHYPLAHAAQVIGRAQLVIGMRLHALVIAARLGVPFLALPYDPKVDALLEELRYPLPPLFVPGAKGAAVADVLRRVDDAWARRDELAAHLRAIVPGVARLAERNFDVLDEFVTQNDS